jgi:cell division protein YceG involved in septum cleavage
MENKNSKSKKIIITIIIILICVLSAIFIFKNDLFKNPVPQIDKEILGNKQDLVFFSINPGQKVSGILEITGSVRNAYFFEANILINVLDANKNVLKNGYANATTDWMTVEPVSFEGSIDFSGLASGPAYIEIHNDNASGLPENDKSILIPVIIE